MSNQQCPQQSQTSNNEFERSARSTVKRGRKRATYNKAEIFQLIDDTKLGHMAFTDPSSNCPIVIPMTFWRVGEHLYFHSLNKSRLDKMIQRGVEICISFAEASQWVLSKSAYHTGVNYRSAVVYCSGERVESDEEFDLAFKGIINDIEPGRWDHIRPPSTQERKATALLKLTINEGSYKSREGGPVEEDADLDLPVWNGTLDINRFVEKSKTGGCPFHR